MHIILVHGRPYRQYIEHYMNSNDKFEDFILKNCDNAMERLGYKSSMVSLIGMWKENCIKKEEFDIEYGITNTEEKNEKDVKQEREDYTVGEDLETFVKRIRIGEITKESIPEDGEYKSSNILCLLDNEERKKLDMKDPDYLETFIHGENADVSEEDWKTTEYKHLKFSKSIAFRRTYVIDTKFVSNCDHEYVQKIDDYENYPDNGSSVEHKETEGFSIQDEVEESETDLESLDESLGLSFATEQCETEHAFSDDYWSFKNSECENVQKIGDYDNHTDNKSSVINGKREDRSVQDRAGEIKSLKESLKDCSFEADDDVQILEFESDDCEMLCVAVHNFQMNESIVETFYALLYVDRSKPDEPENPLAYISVDFLKRLLKTLKKPRHVMSANTWLKGLKTQRFISLADQFKEIDDSHINLAADVFNKRPNSHFGTNSHIIELREIQVS